ncbi:MAG TPA: MFS transporter [Pseudonocardiaceae bacterium]|nr:MFS transporter [Pseudonocardiaceae bacterium]
MVVALGKYRQVLALPGVRALLGLMLLARIPESAMSMVLTLHVVLSLHRSYGAAGLVGAAGTIGIAVGAPLAGRLVDGWGLRGMLAITTIGDGAYWLTAWRLPYPMLLVLSFVGGVLALPVMSTGRQALAALVPEEHRKAAFSLDSISVELSFMVGPAAGVLVATKVSTVAAVISVGCLLILAGIALFVMNPKMRADHETGAGTIRPPRRQWLSPQLLAVLATACGALFVLAGSEVSMVAALRSVGEISWTGVVTVVICLASVIGGFVYGALRRTPGVLTLMVLLSALAIPIGLAGGVWWMLALAMVPSNLMCAPTLAATGDEVSRLAPASVRGEAMGLQSSAFTVGIALGSPVVGFVVDHFGASGGFAAAGLGGVLVALVAWPLSRRPPPAVLPVGVRTAAVSPAG